jgi:hypothetical protein
LLSLLETRVQKERKTYASFLFDWEKEGESLGDGGFDTWVTVEDFNLCSFLCLVEIKSRRELQMS